MKLLAYIALAVSVLCLIAGLYNHFELAPNAAAYEQMEELRMLWMEAHETSMNFGYVAFFGGGLGFLLGLIAFLKSKNKIALVAALLGAVSFFLGATQATHMFS